MSLNNVAQRFDGVFWRFFRLNSPKQNRETPQPLPRGTIGWPRVRSFTLLGLAVCVGPLANKVSANI